MYVKKIGSRAFHIYKVRYKIMQIAEIHKSCTCTYLTQALIELCGIRDGKIQCNILHQNEVCKLIDVLSNKL